MANRFQNLTVDYSTLKTVSVGDRLAMVNSSYGRSLLEALSPEQLASLFPSYYLKRLPDTGTGRSSPLSTKYGQLGESGQTSAEVVPGWQRRTQQTTAGRERSDPSAKAQLSREQKEVFDLLKKGEISADDPRVAFLKDLSEEDLKKAGIQKSENSYKMSDINITPEEIETAKKSMITGRNNQEVIMKAFASELRKKGVDESTIPYAVAALAGQVKQESGFNPQAVHDGNTGYGIYGARDPVPGRGRRTDMLQWLERNGYARDSAEGQARFMVHEAFTKYPRTRDALQSANKDNIGAVTGVLVNDFERPKERENNTRIRTQHSIGFIDAARNLSQESSMGNNVSDEQVANMLRSRREREREDILAQRLNPSGPSATRVSRRGGNLEEDEGRDIYQGMGIRLTGGAAERGYSSSLNRMNPELLGRYHNAIQQLPEELRSKLKITSAFRDPDDPRIQQMYEQWKAGPRTTPMADPRLSKHGMGNAIDIQLGHLSDEERKAVTRAFKSSGLAAPVRREGFNDSHTHLELDRNFQGESAAGRFSERMQQEIERRREATPQINQAGVSAQPGAAAPVAPQTPAQPQTSAQDNVTTDINQSAVSATPIPVRAKGGDVNVNADEIKAMPIGGLKGDNSVVVDENSNPLFTMNTKDESATYNPKTGDVSVKTKADSEGLTESNKLSNTVDPGSTIDRDQPLQNQGFMAQAVQPNRNGPSSLDVVTNLTEKFIKDPSFERAMAKTRFANTGDAALGGHFDIGASNFS